MNPWKLELAAAASNADAAEDLARRLGGTVYQDDRDDARLPFRALVTGVTDDPTEFGRVGDVGCYVVCRRVIKTGDCAVIGLFPLTRRADLSHVEADAHWRDVHAPLALEHHAQMVHYTQLAVVQHISGLDLDGFALCGFASLDDLRQRFFTHPSSRDVILADIQQFADTARSPRRLIVRESSF